MAFPPEDVHRAANEATAGTGIHLLGRRTYELMRDPLRAEPKCSRSIDEVGPNARIEREFDLVAARALAEASDSDSG